MFRLLFIITALSVSGTCHAALLGRLPATSGGNDYQAYYDDALDITWLADANYAKTSGYDFDGFLTWYQAMDMVSGMNTASYLGINTWRLPDTGPIDGIALNYMGARDGSSDRGFNVSAPGTPFAGSTGSELAHLYFNTLGNPSYWDTTGTSPTGCWELDNHCLINTGPFTNLLAWPYWSQTEWAPDTNNAWSFCFDDGCQSYIAKSNDWGFALPVTDGDVFAAVPLPPVAALFPAGILFGFSWLRHRNRP
ncbi:MAG TPA: DUF1566 domain-containing protein [Chromatiales bacterium]|nr:DUF1566 domain-containing protein [Chromatiales bacterium]